MLRIDKENLSPLLLFKENMLIYEAKFLKKRGYILKSSKSERFAKFLGYEMSDIEIIDIYRGYHQNFFQGSLIKNRRDIGNYNSEIMTYAMDKQGYISL